MSNRQREEGGSKAIRRKQWPRHIGWSAMSDLRPPRRNYSKLGAPAVLAAGWPSSGRSSRQNVRARHQRTHRSDSIWSAWLRLSPHVFWTQIRVRPIQKSRKPERDRIWFGTMEHPASAYPRPPKIRKMTVSVYRRDNRQHFVGSGPLRDGHSRPAAGGRRGCAFRPRSGTSARWRTPKRVSL